MARNWVVLGFAVLVACAGTAVSSRDTVSLVIFFESLDRNSTESLWNLIPTYAKINKDKQHLNLNIVPYGRARMTKTDSGESFDCEHGDDECKLNMLIACGNNMITDESKQLEFTYCNALITSMIKTPDYCATPAGLDIGKLKECYNGEDGKDLLKLMGSQTPASLVHANPLPVFLIDGVFNAKANEELKEDSLKFLCNYLNNPSISDCNH